MPQYDGKFFDKRGRKLRDSWLFWGASAACACVYTTFVALRSVEIMALAKKSSLHGFLAGSGFVGLASLWVLPPQTPAKFMRRLMLVVLVVGQFKYECDYRFLPKYSQDEAINAALSSSPQRLLHGRVAIVTGANSGLGLAVSQQLAILGATVVMACRDAFKCDEAAASIRMSTAAAAHKASRSDAQAGSLLGAHLLLDTLTLDLADLDSVRAFSRQVQKNYTRLDFLVNNAGSVPAVGSRTVQGLELALGSMHVGHAALTHWLMPLLLQKSPKSRPLDEAGAARVINVGSQAYMMGSFHPSLLTGSGRDDLCGQVTDNCGTMLWGMVSCCPLGRCPHTNGYARAKLANMLHMHELQRRSDDAAAAARPPGQSRRLVTASLHPGSVQTNIHPFLASMGPFLRSAEQASRLVLHALLSDTFLPGAYLDAMGRAHDLQDYHERFLPTHLAAHPQARHLPFIHKNQIKVPSWDLGYWETAHLIAPLPSNTDKASAAEDLRERDVVAARLWDVTEAVIRDFEKKGNKAAFCV